MKWLVPWTSFPEGFAEDCLVQELRRELGSSHILFGIPVVPLGHRQDCDDVLFQLLDGSERLAVVHLTYAQHPETDSRWPETRLFENWQHFEREVMQPDHAAWST